MDDKVRRGAIRAIQAFVASFSVGLWFLRNFPVGFISIGLGRDPHADFWACFLVAAGIGACFGAIGFFLGYVIGDAGVAARDLDVDGDGLLNPDEDAARKIDERF